MGWDNCSVERPSQELYLDAKLREGTSVTNRKPIIQKSGCNALTHQTNFTKQRTQSTLAIKMSVLYTFLVFCRELKHQIKQMHYVQSRNADFLLRCSYLQVTCSASRFACLNPSKNTYLKLDGLFI